jgi:hypothetical protein
MKSYSTRKWVGVVGVAFLIDVILAMIGSWATGVISW